MKNLTDLLGRFAKSLNKDEIARQAVKDAILTITGIKLVSEDITLKEGVLTIHASAAAKNEMMLKESRILDVLRGEYQIRVSRMLYI